MIEVTDTQGAVHDWERRGGATENEAEGTVTIFDPRGVYTVTLAEAERCLASEPEPEPIRPRFNSGRRQRELRNAETRRANKAGLDPWAAGRMDAPSPWKI